MNESTSLGDATCRIVVMQILARLAAEPRHSSEVARTRDETWDVRRGKGRASCGCNLA